VFELASVPRFACGLDKRPLTPQGFYNGKAGIDDSVFPLVGVPTGAVSGLDVVDVDLDGLCWLDAGIDYQLPEHMRLGAADDICSSVMRMDFAVALVA
jgi:hypothetical protein